MTERIIPFRVLIAIVAAWGLLRLTLVAIVPSEVSVFAPDEAGYAGLVAAVGSGQDWVTYSFGYGASLWPQGRTVLWPSSVLTGWGIPAFTSMRIVSVLYSTASALLLVGLLWLSRRQGSRPTEVSGPPLWSWPVLGLTIFLFLPSHALWNSLALREAATEFWILAAVTLTAVLFAAKLPWWGKALTGIGIAVSVCLAFQSRGYMAAALSIALLTGVVWFGRERPRFSATLALAAVAGTLAGVTLSMPVTAPSQVPNDISVAPQEPAPVAESGPSPIKAIEKGASRAQEMLNPDAYLERGSYQRDVSAQYANSAIATDSCAGVPDPRSLRLCEIVRLPGAAFAVMFRPLWPLDRPAEWSGMAVAASLENLAWVAIAFMAVWTLIRRRTSMMRVLTISLAYGGLLIAGMAALEGNFGTAFRHKSNVLWVFCIVFLLAGPLRRPSRLSAQDGGDDAPPPSGDGRDVMIEVAHSDGELQR